MRTPFSVLFAVALVLGVVVAPAGAHNGHTSMDLDCDLSPNTPSAHGTLTCYFTLNPGNDFGGTDNDKADKFEIALPIDMKVNEAGSHDAPDPSDGEKVGEMSMATDFNFDGCGDANDGAHYSTYWETTWTAFTAPAGWTKVAQFNTVVTVLFLFTENVPTHVIKNNTTGQYVLITDLPEARWCAGAVNSMMYRVFGYAQNNSAQEWVLTNPSSAGDYTITLTATEVGGTTHTDTDTIPIV